MEPNTTDARESAANSAAHDEKERLNNQVALTVAVLAVFMAITKVTDDNICQAMDREKANEVNAWALYQAKSVKQNLAEAARAQLTGLAHAVKSESRPELDAKVARYDAEIARYEVEKAEIKVKAEEYGKLYNALNFRDDQFDLSDATLSVALGMLAVTALTGKRWLLMASWAIIGLGTLMGVAGLAKLKIHSEWLVRLLS